MVVILIKWRWPINWISFLWVKFSTVTKLWSLKLVSSVNSFVAWRLLFTWLSLVHTHETTPSLCLSVTDNNGEALCPHRSAHKTNGRRRNPLRSIGVCSTYRSNDRLVFYYLISSCNYLFALLAALDTHTRSIDVIIPSSSLLQGVLWPERLEFHWLLHMCSLSDRDSQVNPMNHGHNT